MSYYLWMTRMTRIKPQDVTGYSTAGLYEALQDALSKANHPVRVEVVETRGSQIKGDHCQYEITLATFEQ